MSNRTRKKEKLKKYIKTDIHLSEFEKKPYSKIW